MRALLCLTALLFASPAWAGELVIDLTSATGSPVADAVVTVYPAGGKAGGPIHFDWPMRVSQQNIQFTPFVLIAPVGADVVFPNLDQVRHHVYSFSPAKKFQLKLYGREETRSVHFDKAGVVALGCNIHDSMIGFIKVVDTPFAAKSLASGQVTVRSIPPGAVTVRIWHPYLKAKDNEVVQTVTIPAQGAVRQGLVMDLRALPGKAR